MLHLKSESTSQWLNQVDQHLDEILIDHAHCERKAATTAMNLMNSYTENRDLCREMTRIVEEELEHFEMVLCLLDERGIKFRRLAAGPYGRKLNALVSSQEPERAVDRLLIASLIEARSCERFSLLSEHVRDRDPVWPIFMPVFLKARPDITRPMSVWRNISPHEKQHVSCVWPNCRLKNPRFLPKAVNSRECTASRKFHSCESERCCRTDRQSFTDAGQTLQQMACGL